MWRQVNETATRGIEFHTRRGGESQYGEGKTEILDSSSSKPTTMNINFHVHAIDSNSVAEFADKHGRTLARHIRDVFERESEHRATV